MGVGVCWGGGPCMCLCTVYGSHRVHLFKNNKKKTKKQPKTSFFFIIKVFPAKTRNYGNILKKTTTKKTVSAVHSKAEMGLRRVPPSRPGRAPPPARGSCIQAVHPGPPTLKVAPAHGTGRFCTSGFFLGGMGWDWGAGVQATGTQRISRNRDTPQVFGTKS